MKENLNVEVTYNNETDLILLDFTQEERRITVGFDIHEAQMLSMKLAEAITDAMASKITSAPQTRH